MTYRVFGPNFEIPAADLPHTDGYTVGPNGSSADYVCDGTADEVQINQAITAVFNAGQSAVRLLPGTYFIAAQINLKSNVHLTSYGLGTAKIVIASSFNDSTNTGGICAVGTDTTGTAITLSGNLLFGANTINVTPSGEYSSVANDDWLLLRSNSVWESTEQSGSTLAEFVRVNTVSGSSFTIHGVARSTYNTANTAILYRQTFVTNPTISNIEMYQQATLGTRTDPKPLINFNRTLGGRIINCKLHDSDQSGVLIQYSIDSNVTNCSIYQLYDSSTGNRDGYGVWAIGTENIRIENCNMYKVRHALTTGGGSYGVVRGLDFVGNTVSHCTNACVDTHNQSENVNLSANIINNSVSLAFSIRGRATNVIGNTVEWCGDGIKVGLTPYQSGGGSGASSKIIGNTFRNLKVNTSITTNGSISGTGIGCALDLTDNCVIQDNIFENTDSYGLQLQQKVSKCIIKGNTFLNCNFLNTSNVSAINLSANITGTTASISSFTTPTVTLTYTGTSFANYHVGQKIVVSGAATSANNGSFPITVVTATNTLKYTNASGVAPDANNGSITFRIEQNTDNIFESNLAVNTDDSNWDPNSTGGFSAYLCFDSGTNTSGSNVRNIFKDNTAIGMVTGLFNLQNTSSFFAGNSTTEGTPVKNITATADDSLFFAAPQAGTLAFNTSTSALSVRSNTVNTWIDLVTIGGDITSSPLQFASTVSSPTIRQVLVSTNSATGQALTLQAQNATGTTSTGGALNLTSGTGTTIDGYVNIQSGGTTILSTQPTLVQINKSILQLANTINADGYFRYNSTSTTDGYALYIQGQNSTKATSTGGNLVLKSGTGTSIDGYVYVNTGSTTRITVTNTLVTLANSTLQFDTSVSSPTLKQANLTTNSGTGATLTVQAQNETGTTSTGGALNLTSGTGTTVAGNVVIQTGGTARLTIAPASAAFADTATALTITPVSAGTTTVTAATTVTAFTIKQSDLTTNSGTGAALTVQAQNETGTTSTGGALNLTTGTGTTNPGNLNFQVGGTTILSVLNTATIPNALQWLSTTSSPKFKQADLTTNGGTGATLTIQAQNETGTTSTGGALNLTSGTGTTVAGNVVIQTGGTARLTIAPASAAFADTATALTITPVSAGSTSIIYATGITAASISQADKTTNSGTGATLTIQAQNETGTTSTGGALNLTSGTGTSTAGSVVIQTGGTARLTIAPASAAFADTATAFTITPVSAGTTTLQFATTVTAASIKQADLTTNSGTGAALTIQAQNETGTTSTGGALNLTSGTGTSTNGAVNLKVGGTSVVSLTSTSAITNSATSISATGNARTKVYSDIANVQTTDATVTSIFTWTITDEATSFVTAEVAACKSDGSKTAIYVRRVRIKRDGGTVTVGTVTDAVTDEESSFDLDVTIDNSSSTGRIRVTGLAATTIDWGAIITRLEVTHA